MALRHEEHLMKVWVVDDDRSIRWVLEQTFKAHRIEVQSFADAQSVLQALDHQLPDVVLTDVRMPGMDGLELSSRLRAHDPHLPIIVMTAHSDLDSAVSAYRSGAFEYLPKPFDIDEAVDLARRAYAHRHDQAQYADVEANPDQDDPILIGEAPAMQEVFRAIGRLSRSRITVLINGESGTGKELVARALHRHSPRASRPFVAINTAAIPHELLESELFGHERGAFTGAHSLRRGRFEQAESGTLFLDEIGDMPHDMQTRLLRVLSDGEFYRVGGHVPLRADVRVIAATHQNLEQLVRENRFREDLYHRLNVIRIHIPPLRQRRADIPLLLRHFLRRAARELHVDIKQLRPEAEQHLQNMDWPGNVRQLENVCRWLTVMASGREIHLSDLPEELAGQPETTADHTALPDEDEPEGWEGPLRRWVEERLLHGDEDLLHQIVPHFERVLIEAALRRTNGRRQDAARLLGWGRNTLTRKLKELGQLDASYQGMSR